MTRISTVLIIVFLFIIHLLNGQISTDTSPGTINLKQGVFSGVFLNSGGPFLSANLSGYINIADGSGAPRISMFGGQQLDADTNVDVPLIRLTGKVTSASMGFFKLKNNASGFNDTWDIGLNPGSDLTSSLIFTYINSDGTASPAATVTVNGIFQSSDERLKKNIKIIDSALPSVMKVNAMYYNRKNDSQKGEYGFIAQEIEKIYPEMVIQVPTESGDKQFMMNYSQMIPILTKSIQEQQEVIQRQNELIESLSERLTAVEARL